MSRVRVRDAGDLLCRGLSYVDAASVCKELPSGTAGRTSVLKTAMSKSGKRVLLSSNAKSLTRRDPDSDMSISASPRLLVFRPVYARTSEAFLSCACQRSCKSSMPDLLLVKVGVLLQSFLQRIVRLRLHVTADFSHVTTLGEFCPRPTKQCFLDSTEKGAACDQ